MILPNLKSVLNLTAEYARMLTSLLFQKLLPTFEQNDQKEKLKTLKMLLSGQSIRFGVSPVQDFKAKMTSGKFNPEKVRMQRLLRKIQRRLDK